MGRLPPACHRGGAVTAYVVRRLLQLIPLFVVVSTLLFVASRLAPGDPVSPSTGRSRASAVRSSRRLSTSSASISRSLSNTAAGYPMSSARSRRVVGEPPRRDRAPLEEAPRRCRTWRARRSCSRARRHPARHALGSQTRLPARPARRRLRRGRHRWRPSFCSASCWRCSSRSSCAGCPRPARPFLEDPIANLQYLVLPATTLAVALAAPVTRFVRSSMLDVLQEPYIQTGRALGLSENAAIYRHALRNAIPAAITVIGLQLGTLLGGAVVVEWVFGLARARAAADQCDHRPRLRRRAGGGPPHRRALRPRQRGRRRHARLARPENRSPMTGLQEPVTADEPRVAGGRPRGLAARARLRRRAHDTPGSLTRRIACVSSASSCSWRRSPP